MEDDEEPWEARQVSYPPTLLMLATKFSVGTEPLVDENMGKSMDDVARY